MTLHITTANNDQTFRGLLLLGNSYTGPMVNSGDNAILRDINWRRCTLRNDFGMNAETGFHLYNEQDADYVGVTVDGIRYEHGWYPHSPLGNTRLSFCRAVACGGQGYQEVGRDPESYSLDWWRTPSSLFMQSFHALQCGLPTGRRQSFAMSLFGRQEGGGQSDFLRWDRPVTLLDPVIEHIAQGYQLKGGLLCMQRPSLTVLGGRTVYRSDMGQDRATWYVPDTDHIVADRHHFEGTKRLDFQRIKSLRFTGCTGSVQFRINGTVIGPVNQDFQWAA